MDTWQQWLYMGISLLMLTIGVVLIPIVYPQLWFFYIDAVILFIGSIFCIISAFISKKRGY